MQILIGLCLYNRCFATDLVRITVGAVGRGGGAGATHDLRLAKTKGFATLMSGTVYKMCLCGVLRTF